MEFDPIATACFTGHRSIPPEREDAIRRKTKQTVLSLIGRGYDTFIVGGALGFDTLAQQILTELREEFPYIRIVMAVPCPEQDKNWGEEDRHTYHQLLEGADARILISREYTRDCMLKRNRYMVHHASVCIAYCTKDTGGTAYTVRYARDTGKTVLFI